MRYGNPNFIDDGKNGPQSPPPETYTRPPGMKYADSGCLFRNCQITVWYPSVHDLYRKRGKIFYTEPLHKRRVKIVDWYDEKEVVRVSDHYNRPPGMKYADSGCLFRNCQITVWYPLFQYIFPFFLHFRCKIFICYLRERRRGRKDQRADQTAEAHPRSSRYASHRQAGRL